MNVLEFYRNRDMYKSYLEHGNVPKNPRDKHKYLYIDQNGNYIYEEKKNKQKGRSNVRVSTIKTGNINENRLPAYYDADGTFNYKKANNFMNNMKADAVRKYSEIARQSPAAAAKEFANDDNVQDLYNELEYWINKNKVAVTADGKFFYSDPQAEEDIEAVLNNLQKWCNWIGESSGTGRAVQEELTKIIEPKIMQLWKDTKNTRNTSSNTLMHSKYGAPSGTNQYVAKIDDAYGKGKPRYFYTREEYDAYLKNKTKSNNTGSNKFNVRIDHDYKDNLNIIEKGANLVTYDDSNLLEKGAKYIADETNKWDERVKEAEKNNSTLNTRESAENEAKKKDYKNKVDEENKKILEAERKKNEEYAKNIGKDKAKQKIKADRDERIAAYNKKKEFKEGIAKAVGGREAAENAAKKKAYEIKVAEEKKAAEEAEKAVLEARETRKNDLDEAVKKADIKIRRYNPDKTSQKIEIDDELRKYLESEVKKNYRTKSYQDLEDFLDVSTLGSWLIDSQDERVRFLQGKLLDYQDEMNKKIDKDIDIKEKAAEKEITPLNKARKEINTWTDGKKLNIDPELRAELEKIMKEENDSWIYHYDDLEDYLDRFMLENDSRKRFLTSILDQKQDEILRKHGLLE